VVDGDKVYVRWEDGELDQILLSGIDAPEEGECFFRESKTYLAELLPKNTPIYLEQSGTVDRDGSLVVRYVWLPGEDGEKALLVNTKLAREGYAGFDNRRDSPRYFERIREAEKTARADDRGLWGECGALHTPIPSNASAGNSSNGGSSESGAATGLSDEEMAYVVWVDGQIKTLQEANDTFIELTSNFQISDLFDQAWIIQMGGVVVTWDLAYQAATEKVPPPPFARAHQLWIDTTWHLDQAGQYMTYGIDNFDTASIEAAGAEINLATSSLNEFNAEFERVVEERGVDV
jgi:endonuclease YncB( thermonuclease family)